VDTMNSVGSSSWKFYGNGMNTVVSWFGDGG
jgi:hypothetical protein